VREENFVEELQMADLSQQPSKALFGPTGGHTGFLAGMSNLSSSANFPHPAATWVTWYMYLISCLITARENSLTALYVSKITGIKEKPYYKLVDNSVAKDPYIII
jgi:hypothetical protein